MGVAAILAKNSGQVRLRLHRVYHHFTQHSPSIVARQLARTLRDGL
eukprot:SAG31_NODE_35463_length_323_cov_0.575893_1_plen_45_part_01